MNDYDVQMAEAESSDTRAGDYSRRYRDRQILLRQYPGPDAKRFFSWTRGPLAQHLANKEAPKDMPNVVMDLSYALDHQPGEVVDTSIENGTLGSIRYTDATISKRSALKMYLRPYE